MKKQGRGNKKRKKAGKINVLSKNTPTDSRIERKDTMKKFLSLLIVLVFALSVAGCGGDNKQAASSSSSSTQATEQKQAEPKKEAPKEDPNATADQKNAVKKARSYVKSVGTAKSKLVGQLTQFDKFSEADAEYAVNQLTDIDWNKVALKKAESYVKSVGIAKSKLADQLTQFDGFTQEEADYAVANIKADFNEAAAKKAKSYQKTMNMSSAAIHDQLIQFDGFTEEEVNYAISKLQ